VVVEKWKFLNFNLAGRQMQIRLVSKTKDCQRAWLRNLYEMLHCGILNYKVSTLSSTEARPFTLRMLAT
jgi:hypothetical protein